jgi:flavin reductase (DIM6/NTAB) family NADH-FMN oxidoreductase RutF
MKKSLGAKVLAFPAPVWVVGTYGKDSQPNIMTASWAGICCSKPPCIYVSLREATHSYHSIMARKAFTVSIPSANHVKEADFAGIASGKDTDKFAKLGLTSIKSELVDAPYVNEFPVVIECKLVNTVPLGLHTMFVGEIVDVKADESVLLENGKPSIGSVNPFLYDTGQMKYWSIGQELSNAFEKEGKF